MLHDGISDVASSGTLIAVATLQRAGSLDLSVGAGLLMGGLTTNTNFIGGTPVGGEPHVPDCECDNCCGTGLGNVTLPGDPGFDSMVLSAVARGGGVVVSWTMPLTNAGALAYVTVYRNTVNNSGTATVVTEAAGGRYFDPPDSSLVGPTLLYYWIEPVSINGTVGDFNGPSSATMHTEASYIISTLTNQITTSELAAELNSQIAGIATISTDLGIEAAERLASEIAFAALLDSYSDAVADVDTLVVAETLERIAGDDALVTQVDAILVASGNNAAAIITEASARAAADTAIASSVTTLGATVSSNTAAIATEVTARAAADTAISATVTTLTATVSGHTTSISTNAAAITTEATARAAGDTASAALVTVLEATVDGNTAAISVNAGVIAGIDSDLLAHYVIKTDVNGYVAGFGLYNDGAKADFIIHADTFAIGKPGKTSKYPFMIGNVNGVAQIVLNAATVISDLSVKTLHLDNQAVTIPTSAYSAGTLSAITTTETPIQSLSYPSSGFPVWINFSATAYTSVDTTVYQLNLYRDSTLVYSSQRILDYFETGDWNFGFTDTPGSGTCYYYVKVVRTSGNGELFVFNRSLFTIEVKK
jgi:hypothetical protein